MNLKFSQIDLTFQQEMVNRTFPDLKTAIVNKSILKIEGILKNQNWEHDYIIKIFYHSRDLNEVYIINSNIIKHPDLHVSQDGQLCLYYPLHISPFKNFWVTQDLIFQTIKWIYCYESWKLNGHKWKCDEMPHGHYARIGRWLNLKDVHLGLNYERPQS